MHVYSEESIAAMATAGAIDVEALKAMGRADLIGPGKHQLVPNWQPAGTGKGGEGQRIGHKGRQRNDGVKFLTKGIHIAAPKKGVREEKR